jgi:hypothetical protein
MAWSGIETTTIQPVAQYLSQLCHRMLFDRNIGIVQLIVKLVPAFETALF